MKLVVFSPLGKTSAIGRVTTLIVPALIDLGHEVVVVRTEEPEFLGSPQHPCATSVLRWTDEPAVAEAARAADVLIYQIGNNYSFHSGGLHWLEREPGLVCLHDFVLAHLFAGWAATRKDEADRVLCSWYGDDAARTFFSTTEATQFIDMASRSYPMTEWVCAMAYGVISHSKWGMDRVIASCAGPVRAVPLPYSAPAAAQLANRPSHAEHVQILTPGHANTNKRIESVIQAIGQSAELRHRLHYRLCGLIQPEYALELARLARSLGVRMTISGEVDDVALQRAFGESDIVCCLRWPSIEAASATAVESMLYGRAVVVTDTGFYHELPDDCVVKISMPDEIRGLRRALERLVADPTVRRAMAERGQRWAKATFTASNYAGQITDMAKIVLASRHAIDMISNLSAQMSRWKASPELMLSKDIVDPLRIFDRSF